MNHSTRIAATLALLIVGTVFASPAAAAPTDGSVAAKILHTPFGKTNKVAEPDDKPKGAV